MSVGSSGLVIGLTNRHVRVVPFLATLLCWRYPCNIGDLGQHHREGAFVVGESLHRVSVEGGGTRWMGEKVKWAKIQRAACITESQNA